jgi:hypothetical protein
LNKRSVDPAFEEGPPSGTIESTSRADASPVSNVIFFNGSVRALKRHAKPESLKALITHQGGEVVELDP